MLFAKLGSWVGVLQVQKRSLLTQACSQLTPVYRRGGWQAERGSAENISISPICLSTLAASSSVALGRMPGSLKLVWSSVMKTKTKSTAPMTGTQLLRCLTRKGQLCGYHRRTRYSWWSTNECSPHVTSLAFVPLRRLDLFVTVKDPGDRACSVSRVMCHDSGDWDAKLLCNSESCKEKGNLQRWRKMRLHSWGQGGVNHSLEWFNLPSCSAEH